ncbi:hypothetical protein BsWGS_20501 [Bradybaena similaris]
MVIRAVEMKGDRLSRFIVYITEMLTKSVCQSPAGFPSLTSLSLPSNLAPAITHHAMENHVIYSLGVLSSARINIQHTCLYYHQPSTLSLNPSFTFNIFSLYYYIFV